MTTSQHHSAANPLEYRVLTRADVACFRQLRAAMLADTPEAFGSSPQDEASFSDAEWEARIAPSDNALIIGAFAGDHLKGCAGVFRHRPQKMAHKATIWGVYVDPAIRGRGAARSLMVRAIEQASRLPGVRQITLNVTGSNEVAFQLYSSLGFELCGEEPDALQVDGKFYAEKHMFLRLAEPNPSPSR